MSNRLSSVLALLLGGLLLGACASEQKKAPPPPPEPETAVQALAAVKAKVTGAKQAGAAGEMMPFVEISGDAPQGWKISVKESREGSDVKLTVMADPPEGATETPADGPFTHKQKIKLAAGAWAVRVYDHRGVEIKRIDYNY